MMIAFRSITGNYFLFGLGNFSNQKRWCVLRREGFSKMGCKFKKCIKRNDAAWILCNMWVTQNVKIFRVWRVEHHFTQRAARGFRAHLYSRCGPLLLVSCPIFSLHGSHLSILAAPCKVFSDNAPWSLAMMEGISGISKFLLPLKAPSAEGINNQAFFSTLCLTLHLGFAEPRDHRHHSSSWTRAYSLF